MYASHLSVSDDQGGDIVDIPFVVIYAKFYTYYC